MRIRKLRLLLEQYGDTTLRDIIVEIYRQLPRQVIEEKEFDAMLTQFMKYKDLQKNRNNRPSNRRLLRRNGLFN